MTIRSRTSGTSLCRTFRLLAFVPALLCALTVIALPSMQAQTLHVLYAMTEQSGSVLGGLTLDQAGNLYGTAYYGSTGESVFELRREHSSWLFQPLYYFHPQNDGQAPFAPLVFGPDGALYGTTDQGGYDAYFGAGGDGTVFSVKPSPDPCGSAVCLLNETRIYWFGGSFNSQDGFNPYYGPLIFDPAGNIYGTTQHGGVYGQGTAYQLVKTQTGWTEHIIANFRNNGSPEASYSGLTFDSAGNLYGTSSGGGAYGQVYKLTRSGQGWNQQTIYSFQGGSDGANPVGGLVFDAAGNAYGSTFGYYQQVPGTLFELSPQADGTWRETVLHAFSSTGPASNLAMDDAGNLYGTTTGNAGNDDDHYGMAFKLSQVNGSWTFTQLYEFSPGDDGAFPGDGSVAVDSAGNVYGSCTAEGANFRGTIWEITP